ncbi:MAG: CoF synthetase, partial [Opitutaceae bacterium]|nr:CoF synthetase [Opitutaceae bacterium]
KRGTALPSLHLIILTYGKASRHHANRLREVFPNVPQIDLYGSTEAGYLFVGTAFADDSRPVDANAFVELAPFRGLAGVHEVLVTTRGRLAMPLLRYRTGDVVLKTPGGHRLLGRAGSLHTRGDGSLFASADADAALPDGHPLWHYQLAQATPTRWDLHYVADKPLPAETAARLAEALGGDVRVSLFRHRSLAPTPGGKFLLLKPLPSRN